MWLGDGDQHDFTLWDVQTAQDLLHFGKGFESGTVFLQVLEGCGRSKLPKQPSQRNQRGAVRRYQTLSLCRERGLCAVARRTWMMTEDGFSHKPASPWATDQGTLLCLTQPTEASVDSQAPLLFPRRLSCHYSKNKTKPKKPSQKTQLMTRQESSTSSLTTRSPLKPTWALQGFPGPGTGAADGGQEPTSERQGLCAPTEEHRVPGPV